MILGSRVSLQNISLSNVYCAVQSVPFEMDPSAVPEPYVYSAPVTPNPEMDVDMDEDGEVAALVLGPTIEGKVC